MTDSQRQAGAEIEITPEMISAGRDALCEWLGRDGRFTGWDHLAVRQTFLAMERAKIESAATHQ